jgi:GT2 family glycosyltransferase/glycosyltransferase involved in cell wall biosynthesis
MYRIIKNSGLFDYSYYLFEYPDIRHADIDPIKHYILYGASEGRNPCREFDTQFYLTKYSDIDVQRHNPLVHFIRYGAFEGRVPNSSFDTQYYLDAYQDVKNSGMNPLYHYIHYGQEEKRNINAKAHQKAVESLSSSTVNCFLEYKSNGTIDLFDFKIQDKAKKVVIYIDDESNKGISQNMHKEYDIYVLTTHEYSSLELFEGFKNQNIIKYNSKNLHYIQVLIDLIKSQLLFSYQEIVLFNRSFGEKESFDNFIHFIQDVNLKKFGLITTCEPQQQTHDGALKNILEKNLKNLSYTYNKDMVVHSSQIVYINKIIFHEIFAMYILNSDISKLSSKQANSFFYYLISYLALQGELDIAKYSNLPTQIKDKKIYKPLAFYLPQFHPIPENNLWWGEGFTEWTNVTRATQQYQGHYQPRRPGDLGYYDLRLKETQVAQAKLAKEYGLHGFCYYYYWFDNKKMLNLPIENMLKDKDVDLPFCVCWANENWSRNWDGQNRYVLLEQNYSDETNMNFIKEIAQMFKDSRYIRYNGKPLLVIYRIKIIPNFPQVAQMWREYCREIGIGEIHIASVRFGLETLEHDASYYGVDSFVLFPPHEAGRKDLRSSVPHLNKNFHGEIFDYDYVVESDIEKHNTQYSNLHRGAMMGWDNTARRMESSRIFHGATPLKFRKWLKNIKVQHEHYSQDNNESLVFINAWNEWAEGTYLEPDQKFSKAYLEACSSVFDTMVVPQETKKSTSPKVRNTIEYFEGKQSVDASKKSILLVAHIAGHQLFGGERSFLDVIRGFASLQSYNLFVVLPSSNNRHYIELINQYAAKVIVTPYPQWKDGEAIDEEVVLKMSSIILSNAIDIVYVNTIVIREALIAATRLGKFTMTHIRELINDDEGLCKQIGKTPSEIIKIVHTRNDFMIANSKTTQDIFEQKDKIAYIPNMIEVDKFNMNNTIGKTIKIGIISSNIPKKGLDDFVKISQICYERGMNDIAFVVIGPRNDRVKEYEAQLKSQQLHQNITFLGYYDSPQEAIIEMNILLSLSSFAESFGRTIAEALIAQRPVISYRKGAVHELVYDNETGFLVDFQDYETLCDRIEYFRSNREKIVEFGQNGKKLISQNFSQSNLNSALANTFQLLEKNTFNAIVKRPRVKVIVPIYNAYEEVKQCLQYLEYYSNFDIADILLINDCSSDKRIVDLLEPYKTKAYFEVLANEQNLGYTKTINRGIEYSKGSDIILLNSDTIVTPYWIEGLLLAGYKEKNIGTVTAMSNNAGAFSFPNMGEENLVPQDLSYEAYAMEIIKKLHAYEPIEVPTGSGFCMYIKCDVLEKIGLFDAQTFPRGYGEENDFCMRTLESGYKNLISIYSYIYHIRSASFKEEKQALIEAGVNNVIKRYPNYTKLVKEAFNSKQMQAIRNSLQ